jgi:hypothetical protein
VDEAPEIMGAKQIHANQHLPSNPVINFHNKGSVGLAFFVFYNVSPTTPTRVNQVLHWKRSSGLATLSTKPNTITTT